MPLYPEYNVKDEKCNEHELMVYDDICLHQCQKAIATNCTINIWLSLTAQGLVTILPFLEYWGGGGGGGGGQGETPFAHTLE